MTEIEIEGKTVEEAIQEGLLKLGCSQDKVDIKILNEGANGLFGLMGNKPSRVRLTTKTNRCNDAAAQKKAREIIENILKLMNFKCKKIDTGFADERIMVNIESDESKYIIGKNGQNLDALEHIVNIVLNKDEATRSKITIDIDGYRKQQEERIKNIALKAAAQVKASGKKYIFDPMPAKERRLVHMALKSQPGIETASEGDGMFRKVVIKPK